MSQTITALPNYSIYITWDRRSTLSTIRYDILYSTNFDGEYTLVDSVDWPSNEFIHLQGSPSFYYKVKEVDVTDPDNPVDLETGPPMVGDEALVLASLMYELNDLLSVSVHDEEVIFNRDRKMAHVAFDAWNPYPKPEVRITSGGDNNNLDPFTILSEYDATYSTLSTVLQDITVDGGWFTTESPHGFANNETVKFIGVGLTSASGITVGTTYTVVYNGADTSQFQVSLGGNTVTNTGTGTGQVYGSAGTLNYPTGIKYKLDYQGKVFFINENDDPVAVQPYDIVYISYGVKMFTEHEINDAAYRALQAINLQPGTNKSSSLSGAPMYYDPVIVSGACYFLIRGLLLRLTQRELRLLVDDPEKYDMIGNLKELAKMYKDDFDGYLKVVGKTRYPSTFTIVTPEYMMPGGRSRFFRMIWKGGT